MYSFNNDYSECIHPQILEAIVERNNSQNAGYGMDEITENAKKLIRKKLNREDVDIHFLPGGTLTNLTFISHALQSYEAVIAASTGHINVHETGAIEATGHKVIDLVSSDGKLRPDMIQPVLEEHVDEHSVRPAMVYISDTTEIGTVYTEDELKELALFCRQKDLLLYLDGARLSMGLAVEEAELTLEKLPEYLDAFYIGGTKCGAMFGEALVIVNDQLKKNFRYHMKQHGAILAKGFVTGIQFQELFRDDLYEKIGKHCNEMACILKTFFAELGFSFASHSKTNQIFPILPNHVIDKMTQDYTVSGWKKIDDENTAVRFCTSFATTKEEVEKFCNDFIRYL